MNLAGDQRSVGVSVTGYGYKAWDLNAAKASAFKEPVWAVLAFMRVCALRISSGATSHYLEYGIKDERASREPIFDRSTLCFGVIRVRLRRPRFR